MTPVLHFRRPPRPAIGGQQPSALPGGATAETPDVKGLPAIEGLEVSATSWDCWTRTVQEFEESCFDHRLF